MIATIVALSMLGRQAGGFYRKLDGKRRIFTVHLESRTPDQVEISDYKIVLEKPRPSKSKDGKPPESGTLQFKLTDLTYQSDPITRRSPLFGTGLIKFGEAGVPAGIVLQGWYLAPVIGFYMPGADARASSDVALKFDVGFGWNLEGTFKMALGTVAGQPLQIKATLKSQQGVSYEFKADTLFDKDGWPLKVVGSLKGADLAVTFQAEGRASGNPDPSIEDSSGGQESK